jgi:hypothetical protein
MSGVIKNVDHPSINLGIVKNPKINAVEYLNALGSSMLKNGLYLGSEALAGRTHLLLL